MTTSLEAARIATKAEDAYSRDRYTTAGWMQTAKRLATEGFAADEIDWVLRSKHMRWAGDAANRNHAVTAADFANYVLVHLVGGWTRLRDDARKALNAETRAKKTGAYLAGACEGEHIAMALDLLRVAANGGSIQNSAAILLAEIEGRAK